MVRMLFTLPSDRVKVILLPNGMYDVTVLDNERKESVPALGKNGEEIGVEMYCYDGNCFRTVYALTETEILENLENWLNYSPDGEPTLDQMMHDNALIDSYTMELMEGGIL